MLSAGVKVQEKDRTVIPQNVSSTTGGIAGRFVSGPIGVPVLVSSEAQLYEIFGGPNETNFPEWFAAAEFLKYSGSMYVVRALATNVTTAISKDGVSPGIAIKSQEDFEEKVADDLFTSGTYGLWASKLPGDIGNSLAVVMVDAGNWTEFQTWALASKNKYGQDLSTLFQQPPKTSPWVEDNLTQGSGAIFNVTNANNGVGTVAVVDGGSGYNSKSYIEFTGKGTGATGTLVIADGVIKGITVTGGGSGYLTATVSVSGSGTGFTGDVTLSGDAVSGITITNGGSGYHPSTTTATIASGSGAGATLSVSNISDGVIKSVSVATTGIGYGTSTIIAKAYSNIANDELHFLVLDAAGKFSGVPGTVLEKYEGLSKISDSRNTAGSDNYFSSVVNNNSAYIYWLDDPVDGVVQDSTTADANKLAWSQKLSAIVDDLNGTKSFKTLYPVGATVFKASVMFDGSDGSAVTDGQIKDAYSTLADVDLYDVAVFPCGAFSPDVFKHVAENVVYERKDSMAFYSPYDTAESDSSAGKYVLFKDPTSIIRFKNQEVALADQYAQYAVMDSGWKYIFDKYNNKYRWVPLNGDMAGLVARLDSISEPWFSPGGPDRGGIKNVIKLSYNPSQAHRDALYPKGINPIVVLPGGGGVMLYGDRTMTGKPSAFDRINVRRLFSILEKSISNMSKYKLFEINDNFTRTDFKLKVEAYLRNIQSRRGITDFEVRCDASNNTGDVIDRNEFVASIFIQPTRSINFVELSFVATSTGVSFSTVA